jgi:hypothetical protein
MAALGKRYQLSKRPYSLLNKESLRRIVHNFLLGKLFLKRILIVDDDPFVLTPFSQVLVKRDFEGEAIEHKKKIQAST